MKKKLLAALVCVVLACSIIALTACDTITSLIPKVETDDKSFTNKTQEEVMSALGGNYAISVKVTNGDGDVSESVQKVAGGATYISEKDFGATTATLYMIKDGKEYIFNEDSGKYIFNREVDGERYSSGFSTMLTITSAEQLSYSEEKSAKVAGRNVKQYISKNSISGFGVNAGATISYYIDNETGLCLKTEGGVKVTAIGQGSEDGSATFEVTSFSKGGVDLATELAKIDYSSENDGGDDNPGTNPGTDPGTNPGGNTGADDGILKITSLAGVKAYLGDNFCVQIDFEQPNNYGEAWEGSMLAKKYGDKYFYRVLANSVADESNTKCEMILIDGNICYVYDDYHAAISGGVVMSAAEIESTLEGFYTTLEALVCPSVLDGDKIEDTTIIGKSCHQFRTTISMGAAYTMHNYQIIDKDTGLRFGYGGDSSLPGEEIVTWRRVSRLETNVTSIDEEFSILPCRDWINASLLSTFGFIGNLNAPDGEFAGYETWLDDDGIYGYKAVYKISTLVQAQAFALYLFSEGAGLEWVYSEEKGEEVLEAGTFSEMYDSEYGSYFARYGDGTDQTVSIYCYESDDGYEMNFEMRYR